MKFPLRPLVDMYGPVYADQWNRVDQTPSGRFAELTGFSRRSFNRWAHAGIPYAYADEVAVRLGFHPSEIWPEWFGPLHMDVMPLPQDQSMDDIVHHERGE